jgi:hypothetical protein
MSRSTARDRAVIVTVIGLITLTIVQDAANPHGTARHVMSLACCCVLVLMLLLMWPATRPEARVAVARSPGSLRAGRALIGLIWTIRCVIGGFAGYYVAERMARAGFQTRVAALADINVVLLALLGLGRHLAGFPPPRRRVAPAVRVLRFLVNAALAGLIAGYATILPHLLAVATTWVPRHAVRFSSRHVSAWLAWPIIIVVCYLALAIAATAVTAAQRLLIRLLGDDNPLGDWLSDNYLIRYERTAEHVLFDWKLLSRLYYYNCDQGYRIRVRFLLAFDGYSEFGPFRGLSGIFGKAWPLRSWPAPLSEAEIAPPRDQAAAALLACVSGEWQHVQFVYRSIVGHEEIVYRLDPPHPLRDVDEPDQALARRLDNTAARDALRRLRQAHYRPGYGAPFTFVLTLARRPNPREDQQPWYIAASGTDGNAEPAWDVPPTRRQYRQDLRRFRLDRGLRPFWLRAAVAWLR